MEAIADAAGSSVESVYLMFKSKASLLARVVDVALAGDEAPVALADRPMFQEVRDERDQRRQVALLARNARIVLERSGALQWSLITATGHEPEVADLVERYQRRRLETQTEFVRWIAANGPLAPGVSVAHGGQILWTLVSPEVHHMLRGLLAYSADKFEAWLRRMMEVALLPAHR
jgi:AcrR family transcriptional regulator